VSALGCGPSRWRKHGRRSTPSKTRRCARGADALARTLAAELLTDVVRLDSPADQQVRADDFGHALPPDPDSEHVRRIDGYLDVDVL
jgi:hypothetical protein